MRRLLTALALTVVFTNPESVAGQGAVKVIEPIDSLRNMTTMRVVVEDMPALRNVIKAATLEAAIARRLRETGIEVPADEKKDPLDAFTPYLYANINAIRTEPSGYAFSISVQFKRAVEVNNIDGNLNFLFAPTWEKAGLAIIPFSASRGIQQSLDDFVTAFLQDYLAVNPKK